MTTTAVAAVDLGASTGRVIVGRVDRDGMSLSEVHRFPNIPVPVAGRLHWDILALFRGVLDGLGAAGRQSGPLDSIGVDSWAVDYGLLDDDGALLGNPVHYRDERTAGILESAVARVGADEIYRTTGVQFQPFNTAMQMLASQHEQQHRAARHALLIPDLISLWLTGRAGTEITNASTTQLLDPHTKAWVRGWPERLGLSTDMFPALRRPGDSGGELLPEVVADAGLPGPVPVTVVASHDTASAVVGIPATGPHFAYISCGTWSLVGIEIEQPVLTAGSREANFTNELGVDGTVRYLRNVMGLWLLQESQRHWKRAGLPADLHTLLAGAARVPGLRALVDVNDAAFLAPGDLPGRINAACRRTGQTPPRSQAEIVRCILDSLALAYRCAVRQAQRLADHPVHVVHLVGGGAQNGLLCQLTADACELPVLAGPVEAAAWGNVLIQARAVGALAGDLGELRARLGRVVQPQTYVPDRSPQAWHAAAERLAERTAPA